MNGGISDTAATATDRKYPPSGVQTYRCSLVDGFALFVDVEATSGDEAADKAIVGQPPKAKVVHIEPAPQRETLTVKKAA